MAGAILPCSFLPWLPVVSGLDMAGLISDDILRECAVIAPAEDLSAALTDRYQGLVDRLGVIYPLHAR